MGSALKSRIFAGLNIANDIGLLFDFASAINSFKFVYIFWFLNMIFLRCSQSAFGERGSTIIFSKLIGRYVSVRKSFVFLSTSTCIHAYFGYFWFISNFLKGIGYSLIQDPSSKTPAVQTNSAYLSDIVGYVFTTM